MEYVLYAIFFLSCLVLVGSVLLQPGKTDAGALFTSNISSSAFAPRGTATILSKVTIAAATIFMLSALMLSMPALKGNKSVLSSVPEEPATEATPTTESSPATQGTNEANVAAEVPASNSNLGAAPVEPKQEEKK